MRNIIEFKCRICGHDSYTGPFSTTLYECDNCSAVFGDPKRWVEVDKPICLHKWVATEAGVFCGKCNAKPHQT
jgi:hypothetical protein